MTNVPDDIDTLQRLLQQALLQNHVLDTRNQELELELVALKSELSIALEKLKLNLGRTYGKRSEKEPKGTFNEAEKYRSNVEPKHYKKGRKPLPVELEREERVYELDTPVCACCNEPLHVCGFEESEQLKVVPAQISVIKHRQTKYACRRCEKTETQSKVITVAKPAQPIPGSLASAEALAAVVTAKYCDALPLYRQEQIFARIGFEISRSTLANWCIKAGELLTPMMTAFAQHLKQQPVICADETTVQVLKELGKTAESTSYMWVYRSGEYQRQPVVIYDYQPGRGQQYPQAFLEGYSGYLQTDGYAGYNNIEGITKAGCWAHARRKFVDAQKLQKKKTGKASIVLNLIQKLYGIEQATRKMSPQERCNKRRQLAPPILEKLHQWLIKEKEQTLPKSQLGIAINYTLNQWQTLNCYLQDGELGIDNNITERDIRPFTTGRKNWLFCHSADGADASAVLYSMAMTCRANDLNPYYYFLKLFTELPQRPNGADLSDLMPWVVARNLDI